MNFYGSSNTGRVRGNNEDFFHTSTGEKYSLFIVADGMGGESAGEVASALAVSSISNFIKENFDAFDDIPLLLHKSIAEANSVVYQTAKSKDIYENMGTTVVMALLTGNKIFVANVGDSRCYIQNQDGIKQVSIDHSYVQEMVDKGFLTEEEAKHHPDKNLITRAIGTEKFIRSDVFCLSASAGERILLTSDGLTNMLENSDISQILMSSDDTKIIVDKLISEANFAGGKDNITAIVVIL